MGILEPELQRAPPRPVRLTADGRRQIVYPAASVTVLLAAGLWAFSPRSSPGALLPLFVAFIVLGVYLLIRLLDTGRQRVLLVREGVPVAAVVVSADGRAGSVGWFEAEGKQWSVELRGPAEIGDVVTALYLPKEPGRAIVYQAAGCKAVLADHLEGLTADQSPLTPRI